MKHIVKTVKRTLLHSFYFWPLFSLSSTTLISLFPLPLFPLTLLSFSVLQCCQPSFTTSSDIKYLFRRSDSGEKAAGTQQQVTSSPAYVKTWMGTMVTNLSTARDDGLIAKDSWRERPVSRLKTNEHDVWLHQKYRAGCEWLLQRAADKGNKDRDTMSCYTVILLCRLLEGNTVLLLIFDVYSEHTEQRKTKVLVRR